MRWLDEAGQALRFALTAALAAEVLDDASERRVPGQVRADLSSAPIERENHALVARSTTRAAMTVKRIVAADSVANGDGSEAALMRTLLDLPQTSRR